MFLDIPTRKLYFNAYILPHLDYCSTIWGNCSNELIDKITKFQKRAARVILDKDLTTPSSELFQQLGWMRFDGRVNFRKYMLMYKSLHNLAPTYLSNTFLILITPIPLTSDQQQIKLFMYQNQTLRSTGSHFHILDLKYGTPSLKL